MSHLVFVYGTLKRGQPNAAVMTNPENGVATFVSMAKTVEKWPLVVATRFNIPFMLDKPGHGHHVMGEIYKVDEKMVKYLDEFEDAPLWYQRRQLHCRLLKETTGRDDGDNGRSTSTGSPPRCDDAMKEEASQINMSGPISTTDSESANINSLQKLANGSQNEDDDIIVQDVWFYVLENFKDSLTKLKYYDNYDSCSDHGQPYDELLDDADFNMDYSLITETINVESPVENWVDGMPLEWKGVEDSK